MPAACTRCARPRRRVTPPPLPPPLPPPPLPPPLPPPPLPADVSTWDPRCPAPPCLQVCAALQRLQLSSSATEASSSGGEQQGAAQPAAGGDAADAAALASFVGAPGACLGASPADLLREALPPEGARAAALQAALPAVEAELRWRCRLVAAASGYSADDPSGLPDHLRQLAAARSQASQVRTGAKSKPSSSGVMRRRRRQAGGLCERRGCMGRQASTAGDSRCRPCHRTCPPCPACRWRPGARRRPKRSRRWSCCPGRAACWRAWLSGTSCRGRRWAGAWRGRRLLLARLCLQAAHALAGRCQAAARPAQQAHVHPRLCALHNPAPNPRLPPAVAAQEADEAQAAFLRCECGWLKEKIRLVQVGPPGPGGVRCGLARSGLCAAHCKERQPGHGQRSFLGRLCRTQRAPSRTGVVLQAGRQAGRRGAEPSVPALCTH